MFYFRINRIRIRDNREAPAFLGLFGPDRAEVKIVSFVATDDLRLPGLDAFRKEKNAAARRRLLAEAARRVAATRVLAEVEGVRDGQAMTFGDTGYVLYQGPRIPEQLHWTLLAFESDRDVREFGAAVEAAATGEGLGSLARELAILLGAAANPGFAAAAAIAKVLAGALARSLKRDGDDMIGALYMSLNRREHYPHGERKRDGVADLTGNMVVDYSLFGFDRKVESGRRKAEGRRENAGK